MTGERDLPPCTVRHEGVVAVLEFNRPERNNALRTREVLAIRKMLSGLAAGSSRAVVISGGGKAFCAGADVEPGSTRLDYWKLLQAWGRLMGTVENLSVPAIAAVDGLAVCGGFELLLSCHFAVVADDAVVGDQHVRFGLHPGAGSTSRLPRMIGRQRAAWYLATGSYIPPAELVALGLARAMVPRADTVAAAVALGEQVAARRAETVTSVLRCVNRAGSRTAFLRERVACMLNSQRLGSAAVGVREARFAENDRHVPRGG